MNWKSMATNAFIIALLMATFVLIYQYTSPEYAFGFAFARIIVTLDKKS